MAGAFDQTDLQKVVEHVDAFRWPDGRVKTAQLAQALDVPYATMQHRVKHLIRTGQISEPAAATGFEIKSISTQHDEAGAVKKTFVKQVPERGPKFEVPEGHIVKGRSALVDSEGRVLQEWVKTGNGAVDPLVIAERVREHFDTWKPNYKPDAPAEKGDKYRLALLPVSDLHVGLFSWSPETGENWDLKIARKVILDTYAKLFEMTPKTDECFILFGGDQQHSDFYSAMTEKSGNILDVDGRFPKVMLTLFEIAVEMVLLARKRHRKVKVRVIGGNHDRHSSIALAYFMHAWFREDKAVEIDTSPSPFWFYQFGKTMLAGVHGHTIKANAVAGKVAAIEPEMWGRTIYRCCHYFHEHHDEIVEKDEHGMKVRKHKIIAPPDAYGAAGPHSAFRGASSFIYDYHGGELGGANLNVFRKR